MPHPPCPWHTLGRLVLSVLTVLVVGCSLDRVIADDPVVPEVLTPVDSDLFVPEGSTLRFQTNDTAHLGKTFLFAAEPQSLATFTFEVTMVKDLGAGSGGFGLVFQRQDRSNFWFADIDVNGNYCVGRVEAGQFTYLTGAHGYTWVGSAALRQGYGIPNTLRLDFDGSQYVLSANGTAIFTFLAEETPASASLGLNVAVLSTEKFPEAPVSVQFTVVQPSLTFPTASMARSSGDQP